MKKILRDIDLEKRMDAFVKGTFNKSQFICLLNDLASKPMYLELLETELLIKYLLEQQLLEQKQQPALLEPQEVEIF